MGALIDILLVVLASYLAIGLAVAARLAISGLSRIDPSVKGSTRGFRLVVFPGLVALWPAMIALRRRAGRGAPRPSTASMRRHRSAHLAIWLVLTPLLLGTVILLSWPRPVQASGTRP